MNRGELTTGALMGVYEKLDVRPVIHGAGTTTRHGGSIMRPETIAVMREAAQSLVNIDELRRHRADPRRARGAGDGGLYGGPRPPGGGLRGFILLSRPLKSRASSPSAYSLPRG